MHHETPAGRGVVRTLLGLAAAVASLGAAAQDNPPLTDSWHVVVGAGVLSGPRYPGASERRTLAAPLLGATYGRYFFGGAPGTGTPAGIGAYLVDDAHWKAGVGVGMDFRKPRKESDDPRLAGLGDIDGTARASLFANYTDGWLGVNSNLSTDVGGHEEGTLFNLDLEGRYRVGDHLVLSAGPGLEFADKKYAQTFFGIDGAQSLRSGRAEYSAKGGLNTIRFSVGANYALTPQWGIGLRGTVSELHGSAADSPVTGKKNQDTFGLFASYRF